MGLLTMISQIACTLSPHITLSQDSDGQVRPVSRYFTPPTFYLYCIPVLYPSPFLAFYKETFFTLGQYCYQVTVLTSTTFRDREEKFYLGTPFSASIHLVIRT